MSNAIDSAIDLREWAATPTGDEGMEILGIAGSNAMESAKGVAADGKMDIDSPVKCIFMDYADKEFSTPKKLTRHPSWIRITPVRRNNGPQQPQTPDFNECMDSKQAKIEAAKKKGNSEIAAIDKILGLIDTINVSMEASKVPMERRFECRSFATTLRKERRSIMKMLGKLSTEELSEEEVEKIRAGMRSTNVKSFKSVWEQAMLEGQKGGLLGVKVTKAPVLKGDAPLPTQPGHAYKPESVSVDIVGEDGVLWIKVSTVEPMALRKQCNNAESNSLNEPYTFLCDEDKAAVREEFGLSETDPDPILPEPRHTLYKTIRSLVLTANKNRVQYKIPKVQLRMDYITKEDVEQCIDEDDDGMALLFDRIRELGVEVLFADEIEPPVETNYPSILNQIVERLNPIVSKTSQPITQTVLVDPTILITLASDMSHGYIPDKPFQRIGKDLPEETLIQIRDEKEQLKLYEDILLPLLHNKRIVTTRDGLNKFRELVNTLGSEHEKKRQKTITTQMYGGWQGFVQLSKKNHGEHRLQIPITALDFPTADAGMVSKYKDLNGGLLSMAKQMGYTLITQNQELYKIANQDFFSKCDEGPHVVLVNAGRSLLGDVYVLPPPRAPRAPRARPLAGWTPAPGGSAANSDGPASRVPSRRFCALS